MDTRYWGPSGWILLHSIASQFPNQPSSQEKEKYKIFFKSLPIILPCIYCRRSLNEYYNLYPLDNSVFINKKNLSLWLYKIHNLVNDKLRKQGLNDKKDPNIESILEKYRNRKCCTLSKSKNFLYSIALNYPENEDSLTIEIKDNYRVFFNYLAMIFPNTLISKKVKNFIRKFPVHRYLKNRKCLFQWVYMWERIINENCPCYQKRISETSQYIAGCKGIGDEKPTCRKLP